MRQAELFELLHLNAMGLLDRREQEEFAQALDSASAPIRLQIELESNRVRSSLAEHAELMRSLRSDSQSSIQIDDRSQKAQRLLTEAQSLPELQRTVFIRAFLGGQSLRQIGEELNVPLRTVRSAISRAAARLRERPTEPFADPMLDVPKPASVVAVQAIDAEVIHQLRQHPERMRDLPPRKFEELIAEIFKDIGCEVQLTPQTHDDGRDVLVAYPTPFGKVVGIVECKRWGNDNPVSKGIVERFLFTLRDRDRAAFGVIAATTYFTNEAKTLEKEYRQLLLKDMDEVTRWLGAYGTWSATPGSLLWVPSRDLVRVS